jgi:hypothetical protein
LVYAALALIPFFDANSRALMDYAEEIDQLMRKVPCARKLYIGEKKKVPAAFGGLGAATTSVRLHTGGIHAFGTQRTLVSINKTNSSYVCMYYASVQWMNGPAT